MALTRSFEETVRKRALRDRPFREALFKEGIECLLSGEVDVGKSLLRDYINATLGFEKLGSLTDKSPKSLMRMFSPNGNPRADNLFGVISALQQKEGVTFHVRAEH